MDAGYTSFARSGGDLPNSPWMRQVEAGVTNMDPNRWRSQVEARLTALEQQLHKLLNEGRLATGPWEDASRRQDAGASTRDVDLSARDGTELEKLAGQSDSSFSDSGSDGLVWPFCEAKPKRRDGSASMTPITEEEIESEDNHALAESVWDAAVFAGLEVTGWGVSSVLVLLAFLNLGLQAFFCRIVIENMLEDEYNDEKLSGLLKFRTSTAHSIRQADFTASRSLASQICNQDDTLPWAGAQFTIVSQIKSYLGIQGRAGAQLCILAIFLWLVKMATEMDDTIHLARALIQLPARRETVLGKESAEGPVKLLALSRVRLLGMLSLLFLRLAIAVILTYTGAHYLVITVSLPDLILNSMALSFITDIDEMLYAAFMPRRVKNLQGSMDPLPVNRPRFSRKFPATIALGKVAIVIIVLTLIKQLQMETFYERVAMAGEIMCGGNKDFVYTVNPATGIVTATPTFNESALDLGIEERASVVKLAFPELFEDGAGADPKDSDRRLLLEIKENSRARRLSTKRSGSIGPQIGSFDPVLEDHWNHIPGIENLRDSMITTKMTAKLSVDTSNFSILSNGARDFPPDRSMVARLNLLGNGGISSGVKGEMCFDILPAQLPTTFLSAMHSLFPDKNMSVNYSSFEELADRTRKKLNVCQQFGDLCQYKNMTRLRALCPITCGCHRDTFTPAAFFAHPDWGCPSNCRFLRTASKRWRTMSGKEKQCIDDPPEQFSNEATLALPPPSPRTESRSPDAVLIGNYLAAYISGAFQYLRSKPDFGLNSLLIVHNPLVYGSMNLSRAQRDEMASFITSWDFVQATQSGRWEMMPHVPHPRGLQGCTFWTSWEVMAILGIDLCEETEFRSLRFQCPKSCGCLRSMRGCPSTCPAR